jgi:thymidylate synthase
MEVCYPSLGETWCSALAEVYRTGRDIGHEIRELRGLGVGFARADFPADPLLARFVPRHSVEEMRKVFFSGEPNQFGHSYADRLRGPRGRRDLSDVTELLQRDPLSKRALVTLEAPGDGSMPCINAIHFLRRGAGLEVLYFSRGQDLYRKFCPDALCIYEMAGQVAAGLGVAVNRVGGVISSAHIYTTDLDEVRAIVEEQDAWASQAGVPSGVPG